MATRRRPLTLLLIALALALAGCGEDGGEDGGEGEAGGGEAGGGEAVGSPFERDACELLTSDDVAELLGRSVEGTFIEGDEQTATPGQCEWAAPQGGDGGGEAVRPAAIQVLLGDEQIFENTRVIAQNGDDYEELDGLGDEAYAGGGEGGVLFGDAGVTVVPIGVNINDPATHDLIVDILERVAANY